SKSLFSGLLWLIEAEVQKTISEEDFFKMLPEVKSDAQKYLQTVQVSTAWLKTQYGDFKIKPERIPVISLNQHLEEKYAGRLKEKNLSFHFQGDTSAFVETDRILIEFVLDKILNNAVKYSMPGQDIYLKVITEKAQVILSVTDSGTGMDEKFLANIYTYDNPVFQGTAGETGVGLSLKIVKNFISLMQGSIEIISS